MKQIHITKEQYERLREEETNGKICLKIEMCEDKFEMSDCCYKCDECDGYLIDEGAYKFAEREGFSWN